MKKQKISGTDGSFAPTPRSRVKRLHDYARYDRKTVYEILDAGLMAHVGYIIDDKPYVTPTAYWREGAWIYWHGSSASRMLRSLEKSVACCVSIAHMDGLVLARSGFNSSINYRSVTIFGEASKITDEAEKLARLIAFSERLTPGRWPELRPHTKQEMKATTIMGLHLEEVAAKVTAGPPKDDDADYDHPVWAGVLPITRVVGAVEDDPRNLPGIKRPKYLSAFKVD